MIRKILQIAVLFALTTVFTFAQTPAPSPTVQPSPTPVGLETILTEAEKQTVNYQEAFKDLLAIETKNFQRYNKNGELKEESVVESNFFVYETSNDSKIATELRNVLKVDDKPIPDSQERANRFLAELQKTKTLEKELEKIQDESLRYDKTIEISGFTLFEAVALANNLRPVFDFKLLGKESYEGRDVYIVSYQQTRKSPFITVNEKQSKEKGLYTDFDVSLPGDLKKADKFLRGKLWIDAENFQIWREERQLTVQAGTPLVVQETIFEYAASEFGILVPRKISFLDNNIKKISKSDNFEAVKNARAVFDYSKFKKTNVDIQFIDEP